MPVERGVFLRVAHEEIDHERDRDHAREIVVEPGLVADRLEPERDRIDRSAEDRDGQSVGQTHAQRTDLGGEQLGFHHRVDRGVAGHDHPGGGDQQESRQRPPGVGERRKERNREQHPGHAEADEQPFAPDPIGDRAVDRLQDHGEDQRGKGDERGLVVGEPDRQLEELLHIGRVGVEGGGAAGGEPDHQQDLAWIVEQHPQRRLALRNFFCCLEGLGLVQAASHDRGDDRQRRPDDERDAPAPGAQLLGGEKDLLQQEQHNDGAELPADQGDVLEARIEAAMAAIGDLGEIGRAGAVLAAEAQPLDDARDREHDRRGDPDRGIGRGDRDHQRAEAHQRDRQHQRVAPPVVVREMSKQPASDRTHQESGREQHRYVELLHHDVLTREEGTGEIERESGIGVEIEPFDQVADGADEDRLEPSPHVGEVEALVGRPVRLRDGVVECGHRRVP